MYFGMWRCNWMWDIAENKWESSSCRQKQWNLALGEKYKGTNEWKDQNKWGPQACGRENKGLTQEHNWKKWKDMTGAKVNWRGKREDCNYIIMLFLFLLLWLLLLSLPLCNFPEQLLQTFSISNLYLIFSLWQYLLRTLKQVI